MPHAGVGEEAARLPDSPGGGRAAGRTRRPRRGRTTHARRAGRAADLSFGPQLDGEGAGAGALDAEVERGMKSAAELRLFVRQRAGRRCEYCRFPEGLVSAVAFQLEHVRAKQHGGKTEPENL